VSAGFDRLAPSGVWAAVEDPSTGRLAPVADWPTHASRKDAWLILGVAHGRLPTSWRALDFDNPDGDPGVGDAISTLVHDLIGDLAARGVPAFAFPSRSGFRRPRGRAQHLYAWMPAATPEVQEDFLLAALARALGRRPEHLSRRDRLAHGLDPDLHLFFPPAEDVGAALAVAPCGRLPHFRRQWARVSRSDTKKL